jgi:hypothetical protein
MKIDVEGHEFDTVRGMKDILEKRMVKYIFIEITPCSGLDNAVETVRMITKNGYDCYDLYDRGSTNLEEFKSFNYMDYKISNVRDFFIKSNYGS